MTITSDAATPATTTPTALLDTPSKPPAPSTRTRLRRLAARVRNAARDRQPLVTLSEQVLSDIRDVHSVHR